MKNQELQQSTILSENIINSSFEANKQKTILLKCCGNNQVFQLCINQKCKSESTFTCCSSKCNCQLNHKLCLKANLSFLLQTIESKILNTENIKAFIEQKIEAIIQSISKFRDKLLNDIEKDLKYTQLFQVQKKLLRNAYSTQKPQFKPTDSVLLWKIINFNEVQTSKMFDQTNQLLKTREEETKKSIQKANNSLLDIIKKEINKKDIMLKSGPIKMAEKGRLQLSNSQNSIIAELTKNSALCKTDELSERLIKFFPKPLKSINFLFRASDHGFKLAKFYEMCGLKTHTLIICKSDMGKIVGCYTPFSYYRQNLTNDIWVPDPNRESFMFSLTNNDKFVLSSTNNAIYISKSKSYVYFGNAQIYIHDNSNSNTSNYLRCNLHYINEKYTSNDKQSYLSFNGNYTQNCKISEWQVWQVDFE